MPILNEVEMSGLSRQMMEEGVKRLLKGDMREWLYNVIQEKPKLTAFLGRDLIFNTIRNALVKEEPSLKNLILASLCRPVLIVGNAVAQLAP